MWLRERMQYIFATELNFHESNFLESFYHMKIFRLFSECYILNIVTIFRLSSNHINVHSY